MTADPRQRDLFEASAPSSAAAGPAVHTVPSGVPFADALAAGIIERYRETPGLSRVRILLPTRRAVRTLRDAFLRQGGGAPMLLPIIRPIGDVDEDEVAFEASLADVLGDDGGAADILDLPPAIPAMTRHLLLTELVVSWGRSFEAAPQEPAHAARLAADLARLIDQVQTEQVPFSKLADLVPDTFAEHWQKTLKFLRIVTEAWPAILTAHGFIDPAERRNRLLAALAARWRQRPPADPVIAAGSTGTVPATAQLLAVVAGLPQGAVVLPGLDQTMEDEAWRAVDRTHPQFGMKQLLERLDVRRDAVGTWRNRYEAAEFAGRAALLSEVMRPALTSERWRDLAVDREDALHGLTRIDCPGPREEAGVIALLMREALETSGRTAALVTADRALARRVAAELRRWDIEIDDSAGLRLKDTAPGTFLRLTARMVAEKMAPVALLATFKHPLAAGGEAPARFRAQARRLETAILRGTRPGEGFKGLQGALLRRDAPDELRTWLRGVERAAHPLIEAMASRDAGLARIVDAHLSFVERLAASDAETGAERLWSGEAGEALAVFFSELREAAGHLSRISGAAYADLLEALLGSRVVRPRFGLHPRLSIWGPLEARLQHADLLILGGLNEGTWPPVAEADPWFSRPMRERFGLPLPERRIGLSAHDFVQSASAPEVVLTRALKVEGTPTAPSRWLLRLKTLVGAPEGAEAARAARYLGWVHALDWPGPARPVKPPAFAPPLDARPRELSATDVEMLVRNPYGVFAKRILELRRLDPLDATPGAADRGSFIHQALDDFVAAFPAELPDNALAALHDCGRKAFGKALEEPIVAAFWWPWFLKIADWFIAFEQERRRTTRTAASEVEGRWTFDAPYGPFAIRAKADRIDRLPGNGLSIIDYKTGVVPKQEDVQNGLSPQLPIEAVIAEAGGFDGIPAAPVEELAHWKLGGSAAAGKLQPIKDAAAAIAATRAGIEALIARFDDPETPYLSRPRPYAQPRFDDYEHLARFKEWAAEGEADA